MQSDIRQIYKLTSERTGEPEQLYKDIGNFVQQELVNHLKKPKSLIIKLKGVGFWFLRKKRMEEIVALYPENYDGFSDFETKRLFLKRANKLELYRIFKERLADYSKYLFKKQQTKKNRDEFEKISGS